MTCGLSGVLIADDLVTFVQQMPKGLQVRFVCAIIAVGCAPAYGAVRLLDFGYGDVCKAGAFVSGIRCYGLSFIPVPILVTTA